MKNKGFTLIELLAVIVVLAVIALIATPIVLNLVEKSRVGAAESSSTAYVKAVENGIMAKLIEDPTATVKGTFTVSSDGNKIVNADGTEINVDVKGTTPKGGTITIADNGEVTTATLYIKDYTVSYKDGKSEVVDDTIKQAAIKAYEIFKSEYVDAGLIQEGTTSCYANQEHFWCLAYAVDPEDETGTERQISYYLSMDKFLLKYDGPAISYFGPKFVIKNNNAIFNFSYIEFEVDSKIVKYFIGSNGEVVKY